MNDEARMTKRCRRWVGCVGSLALRPSRTQRVSGFVIRHSYCRENLLAPAPTTPPLAERERRLLQLLVQGKRNREMAVQLGVTAKSIEPEFRSGTDCA